MATGALEDARGLPRQRPARRDARARAARLAGVHGVRPGGSARSSRRDRRGAGAPRARSSTPASRGRRRSPSRGRWPSASPTARARSIAATARSCAPRGRGRLQEVVLRRAGTVEAVRLRRARALARPRHRATGCARMALPERGRSPWSATPRCGSRRRRVRPRRVRVPVRGRLAARPRAGVGRGLPLAEILKRYTTTTMGPCQGAMCGRRPRVLRARPRWRRRRRRAPHHGAAAGAARDAGDPRRGRARDRRRTHLAPRAARRRGREDGPLGRLAAPVHLRRLARGVPRGPRAREPDGRRHAREVHDRRARRRAPWSTACSRAVPTTSPPGRTRYVLALDEAGYVMDDGLLARCPEHRVVPDLDLGRRGPDGRLAAGLGRPARPGRAPARPDGAMGRDQRRRAARARAARSGSPTTRSTPPRSPTRASPRSRWRACRAARSGRGFVGELAFELHHPRSRGPELWHALAEAGREWDLRPARARRARGAPPGEGPRLPRPGHDARRHAGEARDGVGGRDGQAVVRGQARARADGGAARWREGTWGSRSTADPRTPPSCAGNRCWWGRRIGRPRHVRRALDRASGRAIGLGWVRAVDGAFPDRARDRLRAPRPRSCRRRSTTRRGCGCVAELRIGTPRR